MKVECFVVNCPFVFLKENCSKLSNPKKKKKKKNLPPQNHHKKKKKKLLSAFFEL